ncbi:hypothetical protein K503DRAFT_799992 [Rhizopogon vinicolor AM-OR11-026]|uniref:LNS2/PITP domain-containing protein n=1 Tax=Rhizopogon vinicolor AM-OR11-026 TaxID=1314800 RepID=A0A1B7N2D6_9AGAM|nr:hypothetical protein K503DRAFT_799992 [Rhizopogon vinicolor AM-OR11-026]
MIGRDWTHSGVDIKRNGYENMYLTLRAIGQAHSPRDYLKGIKQDDYQLPESSVTKSLDRLMASLHRYMHMTDLVNQMFPPILRKWAAEITDLNYWKAPIQEFGLHPGLTSPERTIGYI